MRAENPKYNPDTGRIDALWDEARVSYAASFDVDELNSPEGKIEIRKALRARAEESGGFLRYDSARDCLVYASDGRRIEESK